MTTALGMATMAAMTSAGMTFWYCSYYYQRQRRHYSNNNSKSTGTGTGNESNDRDDSSTNQQQQQQQQQQQLLFTKALHSVHPILQKLARAKVDDIRQVVPLSRDTPGKTNVVRIALTGGPCAGKSSALAHLRECATAKGFDVYTAPEVATLLFNAGIVYPVNQPDAILEFQKSLCKIQLHLERNMTTIIETTGRPSILIFDRGLLDVKGYINNDEEVWQQILQTLDKRKGRDGKYDNEGEGDNNNNKTGNIGGVTEEYCLKRYTGVIHLVTAAEGAIEYYKSGTTTDDSGNVVIRRESPQEAIELDYKMREAWKHHPNQFIISNEMGKPFQHKLNAAASAVLSLAEQTHPTL